MLFPLLATELLLFGRKRGEWGNIGGWKDRDLAMTKGWGHINKKRYDLIDKVAHMIHIYIYRPHI